MGTKLWGPDTWYVIHVIADSAPDNFTGDDTANYEKFYRSLAKVIPCPACALHFEEFISSDPPVFKTRVDALLWTIRAHNNANKNTDKKILTENEGLDAIHAEIDARNNGTVRGRISTWYEKIIDSSIPVGIGIIIGVLLMILIFRKKL